MGEERPQPKRDDTGRVIPLVPNSPLTTPQPDKSNTGFNFQRQSVGSGGVTINVNNPNATASDIIKKLDDYYKATGSRPSQ